MNVQQNSKKGFTIIEVVLVLAIAALIFLMIFVALPALQRGQRNTARKDDVGTIASAINSWRSNHNGVLVKDSDEANFRDYIDKAAQIDKTTIDISADNHGSGPAAGTLDTVIIYPGAKCSSDGSSAEAGNTKGAAVLTRLEEGSGDVIYCQSA